MFGRISLWLSTHTKTVIIIAVIFLILLTTGLILVFTVFKMHKGPNYVNWVSSTSHKGDVDNVNKFLGNEFLTSNNGTKGLIANQKKILPTNKNNSDNTGYLFFLGSSADNGSNAMINVDYNKWSLVQDNPFYLRFWQNKGPLQTYANNNFQTWDKTKGQSSTNNASTYGYYENNWKSEDADASDPSKSLAASAERIIQRFTVNLSGTPITPNVTPDKIPVSHFFNYVTTNSDSDIADKSYWGLYKNDANHNYYSSLLDFKSDPKGPTNPNLFGNYVRTSYSTDPNAAPVFCSIKWMKNSDYKDKDGTTDDEKIPFLNSTQKVGNGLLNNLPSDNSPIPSPNTEWWYTSSNVNPDYTNNSDIQFPLIQYITLAMVPLKDGGSFPILVDNYIKDTLNETELNNWISEINGKYKYNGASVIDSAYYSPIRYGTNYDSDQLITIWYVGAIK